jgi:hypothetical protein
MIYLLFPLYTGSPDWNFSYITTEVSQHETLEEAQQYVLDQYAPEPQLCDEDDPESGICPPPVDPARWKQFNPREWRLELSEEDGYDEELWGFEIVVPHNNREILVSHTNLA